MHGRRNLVAHLLVGGLLCLFAARGMAQEHSQTVPGKGYKLFAFDTGDGYSIHYTGAFWGMGEGRRIILLPPENLDDTIYYHTTDGKEGWVFQFADQHWSVFAPDLPGCGRSAPPSNRDLVSLTQKAIAANYNLGLSSVPRLFYAQGIIAAFCIKLRSTTPEAIPAAILVDPVGTRGIQPPIDATSEEVATWKDHLRDRMWVKWGLGPKPGVLYKDSDLGKEGFEKLMAHYDRNAPAFWATVLTGLQTWMQIRNPMHIADWPVLVVRGPHPTPEMDARRQAVTDWLKANGASVEEMDLGKEGPPGLSNLPMAGSKAPEVAALFLEWAKNLPDNPRFHPPPPKP